VTIDKEGALPAGITEWDDQVKAWLNENLDTSYGARFRNPRTDAEIPKGVPKHLRDKWSAIRFRTDNLHEMINDFS
jgi:hypothetical protein